MALFYACVHIISRPLGYIGSLAMPHVLRVILLMHKVYSAEYV
jgi:hypothetical protein